MPKFTMRLIEQVAVAAVIGFLTALEASGYDVSKGGIGAAVGAAIRAVYGAIAQSFGDKSQPSVK